MKKSTEHPFVLSQDWDCHWFVVPRVRLDEWRAWNEAENPYAVPPDYAIAVGGAPSLVTFYRDGNFSIG